MPKNPGQKKKILIIRNLLYEKTDENHGISIEDVINHLENDHCISAERKSVKEDIDTLIDMGDDICSYNVVSKKYYYVASRPFELAELKLLTDSVQSSKFITQKKSSELIKKIEGLTSVNKAKELSRQIYVTGKVKIKLYKGNMIKAGAWSDWSLYSEEIATFGEDHVYDQKDSAGFINLWGLPISVGAQVARKNKK